MQIPFLKDVQSMIKAIKDSRNSLEENRKDLQALYTKEVAPPAFLDALRSAHKLDQEQLDTFVREGRGLHYHTEVALAGCEE